MFFGHQIWIRTTEIFKFFPKHGWLPWFIWKQSLALQKHLDVCCYVRFENESVDLFCISVTLIHYFFIWAFECFCWKIFEIFSIGRHHHFILLLCFVSFVLLSILSRLILLVQRVVYGLYLRFLFFRWFVCDQQTSNGRQSNCLELIQIPVPCIPGCSYFQW